MSSSVHRASAALSATPPRHPGHALCRHRGHALTRRPYKRKEDWLSPRTRRQQVWEQPIKMPFPPINLHPRISSPGKELFRKKKPNIVPPQSVLNGAKSKEEKDCEKEKLSTSWPSANLKQLGMKPQPQASKLAAAVEGKSSWLALPPPPPPVSSSCDSVARSSSGESGAQKPSKHSSRSSLAKEEGEEEIRFTLSLTPEAILVIQKRNLEKQMMAKQQKCCASADFRHRRVFPSKRAQGGSKSSIPSSKLENPEDIRTIVKISLLNDQYKYDDVEYEEEDGDVDETVVRKCKEWLKGVESAAAFSKVDKLANLPHLKSC
ncbi:proline-rich protein 18-like [Arapaima gigas]